MNKRALRFGTLAVLLTLSAGLYGCGQSTEEDCKALCNFLKRCTVDTELACDAEQIDKCVASYDKLSGDCKDSFDDVAACVDDHDGCSATTACASKSNAYFSKCE